MRDFFFRKKKQDVLPVKNRYGWYGNFSSWEEVCKISGGYQQENILKKTKSSLLLIRDGKAIYERDSVLFDKKVYPFEIIACLLRIASQNNNSLCVVDFGGSLGSTYFQVREFLSALDLSWNIVEQPTYVDEGRAHFENEQLKFYYSISDVIQENRPHVILLSGVIQYLQSPHEFLRELNLYKIENILFDRTSFLRREKDRLTIQHVPPSIYEASYPAWFFNEEKFLAHFGQYNILVDFNSFVPNEDNILIDDEAIGYDKGFFLTRK